MDCPCRNCKALTCRERCDAYMTYHDALVDARDSMRRLDTAIEDAIVALSAVIEKRRRK